MTKSDRRYRELADHVLGAWNRQVVDDVLDCYTHDLVYLDPNTHGPVDGRKSFGAYLTKLFDRWTMRWTPGEIFPLEGSSGVVIRWNATLAPADSDNSVQVSGLDLVVLRGDLICRNEVYFDRSPLAALFAPAETMQ